MTINATTVAQNTLGDWRRWREILDEGEDSLLRLDLNPGLQNLSIEATNAAREAQTIARRVDSSGAMASIEGLLSQLRDVRSVMADSADELLTETGGIIEGINSSSRQLISTISNADVDLPDGLVARSVDELTAVREELLSTVGRMTGNSTAEVSALISTIESLVEQDTPLGALSAVNSIVGEYLATGPTQFQDVISRASSTLSSYLEGGDIGSLLLAQAPDLLSGVISSFGEDFGNFMPMVEQGMAEIQNLLGGELEGIQSLLGNLPQEVENTLNNIIQDVSPAAALQGLTSFSPRDSESNPLQPMAGKLDRTVQIGGPSLRESFGTAELSSEKGKPPNGVDSPTAEGFLGVRRHPRVTDFGDSSSTVVDTNKTQVNPVGANLPAAVSHSIEQYPKGSLNNLERSNGPSLDGESESAIKVPRQNVNRGLNYTIFDPNIRRNKQ
jgi:hypothetical protein